MKDDGPIIVPIVIGVLLACLASNRIGFVDGVDKVQQEAVIKGHAEWVADTNGKPQFKWKECK
jgi:hypothetical protein